MNRMKTAMGFLAVVGCLVVAGPLLISPASAQGAGAAQEDPARRPVTIEASDADIRAILQQIFLDSKLSYTISPRVQGSLSLNLRDVPMEEALRQVLRAADATYRVEGGVYQIVPRAEMMEPPLATRAEIALPQGMAPAPMARPGNPHMPPMMGDHVIAMVQDDGHLYVATTNRVLKLTKTNLRVVAQTMLPMPMPMPPGLPRPATPPMRPGSRGGGK